MSSSYRPPRTNPLVKITDLEDVDGCFSENLKYFNEYLNNYNSYVEKVLHNIKNDSSEKEKYKKKITCYDYLFSTLKVPKDMTLNILVVENEPSSIKQELEILQDHFKGLKFYLVKDKFTELAREIRNGNKKIKKDHIHIDRDKAGPFTEDPPDNFEFKDIDLILQDIFLGHDTLSGAEIANLYFDVAPQAMVFFLTSMDIETLAASGYDKKVDRLISKDRITGLMQYYYKRFDEIYGSLLWPVFATSRDRDKNAKLTDRISLRRLLGNIRSWTAEPKILFHGFALPEMIDHEFRHTAGLWKMANDILGPFLDRKPEAMSYEERILLSLAIWLHDIGHRGDEHHYEPMVIRENHGAISESLILEHFEALGIEWLRDMCTCYKHEPPKNCYGILNRNKKTGCTRKAGLCVLRKIGLICRYHQSTAPLTANKLKGLITKLKMPSPYCVVGMDDFKRETSLRYDQQIQQWLNKTEDFGCFGTDIRTLDEFNDKEQLLRLTGMLRWLDALHTHRDKVGSTLEVKSFLSYLDMRKKYCKKRILEIDELLDKTIVGSEAYLTILAERFGLDQYSELLEVQGIHLWRSGMVRGIKGEWFWDDRNGKWAYRIVFELYEKGPFEADEEVKGKIQLDFIIDKLQGSDLHDQWSRHVWKEVIKSEIKGQMDHMNAPFFKQYFMGIKVCYFYKTDNYCGAM